MSFQPVYLGVYRPETIEEGRVTNDWFDTSVTYRIDECTGGETVALDSSRQSTNLEREVGITATDQRQVTFVRYRFDLSTMFRVLPVDFDTVEIRVTLPKQTVAEGVCNDSDTVALVSQRDGLVGR